MSGNSTDATLPEVHLTFEVSGTDAAGWVPIHLNAREALSTHYTVGVILAHELPAPSPEPFFEKTAGIEVSRGDTGRWFRGFVRRVEDLGSTGGYRFVRLVLVPSLWTLTLREDARIWQDLPVASIVREVLTDAAVYQGDAALRIGGPLLSLPPREYCVQHQESDADFIQRLLEVEGIPYYFTHDGESESLVLAEEGHAWPALRTASSGPVRILDEGGATAREESIQWIGAAQSAGSSGAVLRDYDFTHPAATLDMTRAHPGDGGRRAVYDSTANFTLGAYDDGGHAYGAHHGGTWARVRSEALRADSLTASGRSNLTGMIPGARFDLTGHMDARHDGPWVVLGCEHQVVAWDDIPAALRASARFRAMLREHGAAADLAGDEIPRDARYANTFSAVRAEVPWRPARTVSRRLIQGPQTARVMAEPGSDEEICVDFHGRILVRFHWERPEKRSSTQSPKRASCWVRVAQSWAGAAWGTMFIPRVGMEVVVQFLEGNPDRPLVTGCVYNGQNRVPYELPEHKTRSTLKTSTSRGGEGFNELRFEDLKDSEQVFLHAQRDYDVVVRHDATHATGNDRTHTTNRDEHLTVFRDRATAIHRDDSLEVEGRRSVSVHGGAGYATHVDARYKLNADAGVLITCGSSSIEMLPDRITITSKTVNVVGERLVNINGALVKINCDPPKAPSAGEFLAMTATKALSLIGQPGSILDKAKSLIDPKALAGFFTKGLDKLLEKIGVPTRIRDRLNALGGSVVGEMLTALREGRSPNWGQMRDQAIGTAAGIAVGEAFRPLQQLAAVRGSNVLSGLVNEAKSFATDAAHYGAAHALGLNDGMARDPFWQTMRERHAESVASFAADNAMEAARQYVGGYLEKHGAPMPLRKGADVVMGAAQDAARSTLTSLIA